MDNDVYEFHKAREKAREERNEQLHAMGLDYAGDRGDTDQPVEGKGL